MTKFFALPLVLRWSLVCALLPSALWAVLIAVGVFASGLEAAVQAIGYLFLMIVVMGVPGAVLGLAVGWIDLTLGRYVERNRRRRRAVAVATGAMSAALTLVSFLLQLFLSSGLSALAWFVTSAASAAVPAAICWRRYVRVAASAASDEIAGA